MEKSKSLSRRQAAQRIVRFVSCVCALAAIAVTPRARLSADDWPQWRFDAGRTGASPHAVPPALDLLWVRDLGEPLPAWRNPRLGFDAAYEPVAAGGIVFVGSNRDDSVSAFDGKTGELRWRVYTGGPVRVAPTVWRERLFVASDDGYLWVLAREDGRVLEKIRIAPSSRRVLGNGRLISVWPVRGGPVVADDTVYVAAGVWPFEGVFVTAIDAASGRVLWINDRTGFIYGDHPHAAEAIGGLTPQGYLVVDGDDLIVPCGTAYPARFDRRTGELREFTLPKQSRFPGGWFAALDPETDRALRHGKLNFDSEINRERHEDNLRQGTGDPGLRRRIKLGERTLGFDDALPNVEGEVWSIIAASERLYAVTRDGKLWALGARDGDSEPRRFDAPGARNARDASPSSTVAEGDSSARPIDSALAKAIGALPSHAGYALVVMDEPEAIIDRILGETKLHVVAISPADGRADSLRRRYGSRGLYGARVAFTVDDLDAIFPATGGGTFPRWVWNVLVAKPDKALSSAELESSYELIRPYGGRLIARAEQGVLDGFAEGHPEARIEKLDDGLAVIVRGGLPGATNYLGGFVASRDELVRAPLGVLWFDDDVGHFKRSPQPQFIDGVMVSRPKLWRVGADQRERGADYELGPRMLTDMYTGRPLDDDEAAPILSSLGEEEKARTPVQYRPPTQKDAWSPAPPTAGERLNPLTGKPEPRAFPKSYGCDGGIDYGLIYTMRSGTAAFYDVRADSGTIHISGPRSGCTNSVIPAGGLLNVPYFYEGCTCSYPLPSGLALIAHPPEHEQWSVWGKSLNGAVERVGINFGAPGDRRAPNGTLWLDWPAIGGPSPAIDLRTEPEKLSTYYRHSVRTRGGAGWPWVLGSGARGVERIELMGLRRAKYRVRLFFAEPDAIEAGARVFDIRVNAEEVASAIDLAAESRVNAVPHTTRPGIVREHVTSGETERLTIELVARRGETIISGIEVIAADLDPGELPRFPATTER